MSNDNYKNVIKDIKARYLDEYIQAEIPKLKGLGRFFYDTDIQLSNFLGVKINKYAPVVVGVLSAIGAAFAPALFIPFGVIAVMGIGNSDFLLNYKACRTIEKDIFSSELVKRYERDLILGQQTGPYLEKVKELKNIFCKESTDQRNQADHQTTPSAPQHSFKQRT